MTILPARPAKSLRAALLSVASVMLAATAAFAAVPQFAAPLARITGPIDNTSRVALPGTLSPHAIAANDAGAVPPSTKLTAITLIFSRTPAQQAALDALTAAQQNPASPEYHKWLTPEQFGAQFGAAPSDIAAAEAWLQQQGFSIDGVSRSQDRISFSGTAAQVESAFGAPLHYFNSAQGRQFAPAAALSIPSALASSVLTVANLSSFHLLPHVKFHKNVSLKPDFTSAQSGSVFLTPKDIDTIYDVNAAYNSGYNGAGQSIAILGQSAIVPADITDFQTALGVPSRLPTQILVPNTGAPAINPFNQQDGGDEAESDLDLEYSSSMAPGATVYFVYTGSNTNTGGVFTSLQYAVQNAIANIISISYGDCEADLTSSEYSQINALLQQGAAQGETIVTAAGDTGSTDCSEDDIAANLQEEVSADFPSTSQYVTSMGGTEIPSTDISSTYFSTASGTDVISSAKSYVPEQVWNDELYLGTQGDTGIDALDAGGGGVSTYTPRPSWQTGVTGIPSGSFRLIPDISLLASNYFPGYLFCSSDINATGITGSCSYGFRDANDEYLTVAGGTSFDAPIFSGLVAIINQVKNYPAGQGLVNPTLYTLAANSTVYSSAFHDITSGGNQCLVGSTFCTGAALSDYPAGTGYDEASGLGSIDFNNLLTSWPASTLTTSLAATATTVSPASASPGVGANDLITITVASASSTITTVPAGTVSVSVNGVVVAPALPLTNGVATYTFSSTTTGASIIKATYSGSGIYDSSNGSASVDVGQQTLTLTATNITVAPGASGTSTLTLTPSNGYTGTFEFLTINTPSNLANACASDPANITITGTTPGTSSLTIYTNLSSTQCPSNSIALVKGATGMFRNGVHVRVASISGPPAAPGRRNPFGPASTTVAIAGLFLVGFLGRRSRKLQSIVLLALFAVAGFAITGCSNKTVTSAPVTAAQTAPGTYNLSLTGSDTANSNITGTANFTLTVN